MPLARGTSATTFAHLLADRQFERRSAIEEIDVLLAGVGQLIEDRAERTALSAVTSPRCRLGSVGSASRGNMPSSGGTGRRPAIRPASGDAARSRPGWPSLRPRARPARSWAKPCTVAARLAGRAVGVGHQQHRRVEPAGDLRRAPFERAGRRRRRTGPSRLRSAQCRHRPSARAKSSRTYSREVIQPSRL